MRTLRSKMKRPYCFKGTNYSIGIKFLAFFFFFLSVDDTILCQYLSYEIKRKRTFEVDKNIFVHEHMPILSLKKAYFPVASTCCICPVIKVSSVFIFLWFYPSDLHNSSTCIGQPVFFMPV